MTHPNTPNQPSQPPAWGPAPQAPKQNNARNFALGCGALLVGGLLLFGGCAAIVSATSDDKPAKHPAKAAPKTPKASSTHEKSVDEQLHDLQERNRKNREKLQKQLDDAQATEDAITLVLEATWQQQDAEARDSMCYGWKVAPDTMLDTFMSSASDNQLWTDAQIRGAASDFLNDKCHT